MAIEIIQPGFRTTVQDLGRKGYQRFGVPVAGAMDFAALRAGNALVGNTPDAACLEMAVAGPEIWVWDDCLIVLTGRGFRLFLNGREVPGWMAVWARRGSHINVQPDTEGTWAYLAVSGGIDVPLVMGSRSTYLRGGISGLQGRALTAGDLLHTGRSARAASTWAGNFLPASYRPAYRDCPTITVLPGLQLNSFSQVGVDTFFGQEYQLTPTSDRMAYRLEGPAVEHRDGADIISDGIVMGAVQVPASGQPIIMMSDRQTTGGYTKIGVVATADLPVLAQCRPGQSRIRFQMGSVEAAQESYRDLLAGLTAGLTGSGEEHLSYVEF